MFELTFLGFVLGSLGYFFRKVLHQDALPPLHMSDAVQKPRAVREYEDGCDVLAQAA
jgi:hypothetical protein